MNVKRSAHEMALEGDVAGVQATVETNPKIVTSKDDSGRVPLHWAVSRGHIDLSGWLLDLTKYVCKINCYVQSFRLGMLT